MTDKLKQSMSEVDTATRTAFCMMVAELAKPGEDILASLTPEKCHLLHMAMGVSGEVAELEASTSILNTLEELGDIEFYVEGFKQGLYEEGFTPETVFRQYRMPTPINLVVAAGDLLDMTKKCVIYNKPAAELLPKLAAALHSFELTLTHAYNLNSISRETAMQENIGKLLTGKNARYAAGSYSDKAASERADKKGDE